jgi:carbon-monoxide dehydrogenase large subunit
MDPTLESTAAYDPALEVMANGAHAAIVEVDAETGIVTIERFVAVEDCGTMINPMVVEGQLRGGITQALGAALLEEMVYDDQGQLLTTTFMDYLIPTASEAPPIEIIHIETPSKVTAGGVKGMGESAMIAAPAALVNAVNDAIEPLGAYLTDVPLTPDRILSAITTGNG